MAELDHFYPRKKYPIFSISLYNLVPVCGTCNSIKKEEIIGISPHDHAIDFSQMRISFKPKTVNWINDSDDIDVEFKYKEDNQFAKNMKNNIRNLEIEPESPVALILCAEKSQETIELLELDHGSIHVGQYMTKMPPKELLEAKLAQAIANAREQLEQRGE